MSNAGRILSRIGFTYHQFVKDFQRLEALHNQPSTSFPIALWRRAIRQRHGRHEISIAYWHQRKYGEHKVNTQNFHASRSIWLLLVRKWDNRKPFHSIANFFFNPRLSSSKMFHPSPPNLTQHVQYLMDTLGNSSQSHWQNQLGHQHNIRPTLKVHARSHFYTFVWR
jgi:hypothetical protein